ncbi:hypothetical protein ACOSQ3_019745 [Xanthoceras sorbifolium]
MSILSEDLLAENDESISQVLLEVTEFIRGKIYDTTKENLDADFTEDEVLNALFAMNRIKALRPDGFHAIFFY